MCVFFTNKRRKYEFCSKWLSSFIFHHFTPLFIAARNGNEDIMNLLFDYGATMDIKNTSSKENPINEALRMKNIGSFMILLKRGMKPTSNQNEYSILMLCIANGYDSAVPMLLHSGADVNIKTSSKLNALQIACNLRKDEIAEQILNQPGILINTEGQGGSAAIHWAAASCLPRIVMGIINAGGKINSTNLQGENAIYYALRFTPSADIAQREIDIHNQLETLKILAKNGVDVNLQRKDKSTCIQNYLLQSNVAAHCDRRVVQFLFDAGLDIDIVVNNRNETLGDRLAALSRVPDDIAQVIKGALNKHGYVPKIERDKLQK